ncbi:Bifunctional enzyme CysN/CysC [Legionella massiliensis]|uniref:Multifunctional fusion protein n=1 Tax=Legionella massiliensis TaxID=1034943 RepID=A0A078KTQ2_9GAMM|nr:sulfate adenylyltransferase subunit CysN [Legionella massiliensis]CDZ77840.1 Bifunctional enzyme CysN/CysC [Legionella massiliensis]CEE13578.1 Bifunctional enzyme CysN/CysC [Legionella massiliensis]
MEQEITLENKTTLANEQQSSDLLRFITCGSVDDGKSTLIGRLLWESQQLFDDQITALSRDSQRFGTQNGELDFALLVDGLTAEREQGITIDVAHRFFASPQRKFILADTPGHEQYTRNMVTAASTADIAVVLIDASKALTVQTCRHTYLCSLMGIRHIVLAINKMDLVDYDESVYTKVKSLFTEFAAALNFSSITAIPLSALKGDNVSELSNLTPWYKGPTLMHYLNTIEFNTSPFSEAQPFVFPIQWVNRPNSAFRGFSGTVAEGLVRIGDEIRVTKSGQTANIANIVTMDGDLAIAHQGQAITLTLDKEIDASRGDVLSLAQKPLENTDLFEATIIWMHEEPGLVSRSYELKLACQWTTATITVLKYRINVNTLAHEASKQMAVNDIAVCQLSTNKPIVIDSYNRSKPLGSFILVDRFTHTTVAAGIIHHSLRRAQNIHKQPLTITREHREKLNGHKGKVLWFTGLSGSGKSTIANALEIELYALGKRTYLLDADNIRLGLNKDLGFTIADRVENIRRIAEVAKLMIDSGLIVLVTLISPFRHERAMAQELIGTESCLEIYVSASLEICEARDVKGLYKKARAGLLPNMSGIDSPYEPPENPAMLIKHTDTVEQAVKEILNLLKV